MLGQHQILTADERPAYAILLLLGIAVGAALWIRRTRSNRDLTLVFGAALLGALLGAKLGYFAAELPFGHNAEHFWERVLVGRTILGGLAGGYVGAEIGKRLLGMREATGDHFAVIVPAGLVFGRIGCHLHGCCLGTACEPSWYAVVDAAGVSRWPASLVEALFNASAAIVFYVVARRGRGGGQLFHVYLMAYGAFRFAHEFLRESPRPALLGGISTYQILALLVFAFGAWRFALRRPGFRSGTASPEDPRH